MRVGHLGGQPLAWHIRMYVDMASKGALLPGYRDSLVDARSRERYDEKLELISKKDPYEMPRGAWKDDVDLWPGVTYINVGMYLVFSPSPYSGEDLMNYKSLDCYQHFTAGWVRDILVAPEGEKRLVTAKVNHSQRMREKPLLPWVIAECSGKVIAGHCNCVAGLGETCSHVGSLLWAIEAGVRIRDSMTVTQRKAYWVLPPSIREVPYAPLHKIEFIGKAGSLEALRLHKPRSPTPTTSLVSSGSAVPSPSSEEISDFFTSLSKCSTKPAVLALLESHSSSYIPSSLAKELPPPLSDLFKPEHRNKSFDDLLRLAEETEIVVTLPQSRAVEEETRSQSNSRLWFRMRAGRITASRLKAVCSTDAAMPSVSLILSICHPELSKFSTAATKWGCEHEKVARAKYSSMQDTIHEGFSVTECGFFIHPNYPFMGASPDGLISCLCCGDGLCEVKCPYCHCDRSIEEAVEYRTFCLEKSDGSHHLKKSHPYYYQIQCQLFCTSKMYCDFILWTNEDIHIERVYPDEPLWLECVQKAQIFFRTAVLPEMIGKWFSRPPSSADVAPMAAEPVPSTSRAPDVYCYCRRPESGDMIACDNSTCPYVWFHFECLKLHAAPRRKTWYCPDCRKFPQCKRRKGTN